MELFRIEFSKTPLVEKVFNKILEKYSTYEELKQFTRKLASDFYREYVKALGGNPNLLLLEDPFSNNSGFDHSHEGYQDFLYGLLNSMVDERLQNLLNELGG